MELIDHFRRMAENNCWSNDRLYRAVAALKPGEFAAARTSFFPSIKATLNHLLAVDLYYLDALQEAGAGSRIFDNYVDFDEPDRLAEAQGLFDRRLIAFCDGLTAPDLDRRVVTDRRDAGQFAERIGDLLAHLFIHEIHHRGQVHAMLSGTSIKPPQLDEFFLDYDWQFRKEEVGRLNLGGRSEATS